MGIVTENDLANIVIEYFESNGYEIYKEVVNSKRSNRADIIAVKDGKYTVIETKMSFGSTVIEQASKWSEYSHYRYICCPRSKRRNNRRFGYSICNDYGIGVIDIGTSNDVRIVYESTFNNNPTLPTLYTEQMEQDAGTNNKYITPFKITCKRLVEYINSNDKTSLLTAMKNIDHHYKTDNSAKNAMMKLIKIGVLPELKLIKEGRTTYVSLI